jgi:protein SCO1/2
MAITTQKIIRISSGVLLFSIAAILIGFWSNNLAEKTVSTPFPEIRTTSFDLPSTQGGTISNKDLIGSPTALFFGFTHCPEVCPVTFYTLSEMIEELGPDAASIQIVFATVDPERDTLPILKDYVEAIDEETIGLSGTPDQIAKLIRDFGIYAQKVVLDDGDYTMDHTATVFLYDAEGRIAGTIAWREPDDFAMDKLRSLAGLKS